MADSARGPGQPGRRDDPVLPPPSQEQVAAEEAAAAKQAERDARAEEKERVRRQRVAEKVAKAQERADAREQREREAAAASEARAAERSAERSAEDEKETERTASMPAVTASPSSARAKPSPRRQRRAQLRLVQVDAWSVMKTSFLLSIALGIVLVVAVAIVWSVLGAAGVWDSINSIVQQAVGNAEGPQFDITNYVGTSRVLGFAMIVAVVDVVLITAIATLGAFLYNLSAALLGGIEVTLAEDN